MSKGSFGGNVSVKVGRANFYISFGVKISFRWKRGLRRYSRVLPKDQLEQCRPRYPREYKCRAGNRKERRLTKALANIITVKSAVEQVPASTETSASAQGPSHAQGLIQDSNPEAPAVFGVNIAAAIPNPAPVIVPDGHPGVITRGRNDILMDWIEYTRLTEEIPAWRAEVARRMGRENIEC